MPIKINPYIAGDPVGHSPAFVGRDDVLREVLKVLRNQTKSAITLYGQRRIGKTSMLQYLQANLPKEGAFQAVYFDLQDKAAWPLPRLLAELARTVAEKLSLPVPQLDQQSTEPFRAWLVDMLSHLPADSSLALLFDEFDVLADPKAGSSAAEFFPYLRNLLSLDPARLKFVFVLGRNITDLSSIALSVFKVMPSYRVSLLSQADTLRVVRLSEQNNTLAWPEKAVEVVWNLTHGHPYLTQALCSQVWDAAYDEGPDELYKVTPELVGESASPALDSSRNMLEWLWNGLGPAEKVVSAALAGAGYEVVDEARLEQILRESGVRILIRELQNAPQMLEDWDILEKADGGHVFRVELLRRWIAKYHPLSRTQDELDRVQPAADSLFSAAESFYGQGDLKRAENLLEQAIGINPNHLRANDLLSEILISSNRLEDAREKLEKLIDFAPTVARPRLVQVYLLQAQISPDDKSRLVMYEKVLNLDPTCSEARTEVEKIRCLEQDEEELALNFVDGRQALQRGEWSTAIELLQKVVAKRPFYAIDAQKDPETAADLLAKAVHQKKEYPRFLRAIILEMRSEMSNGDFFIAGCLVSITGFCSLLFLAFWWGTVWSSVFDTIKISLGIR
jgi:tetratricopeptide (TPR) repeat protein